MLQKGDSTVQPRKWLDHLVPLAEAARATLAGVTPEKLTMRTGCQRDPEGNYQLAFLGREYIVSADTFVVQESESGEEPSSFTQSLLLTYLATADGTTPSSRWIGFRELPNAMFYVQAFQGYSGGRLVRELTSAGINIAPALRQAALNLGGRPLELGDAGFAFTVLPRVHMAIVFWEGDDEFPSQARVLFEDTAAHYMPTDGLAILGSQLVGKLVKAALAA
jgi:hypothetical protein